MTKKLIAFIFYFFIQSAFAQSVPPLINYQGMLTDSEGKPLANGTKKLTFNIYESADSTTPVWGPQVFPSIPVINGYFNVILGPVKTDANGIPDQNSASILEAFRNGNRFLGITVDNGTEVKPRQQILSSPYAIRAEKAQQAFHHSNIIPPGTIVPFAGPPEKISTGWILCDGRAVKSSNPQYTALSIAIGTSWGDGSTGIGAGGGTDFNLPDLRGMFLRGVSGNRGDPFNDPDAEEREAMAPGGNPKNKVGSIQLDGIKIHDHRMREAWGFTGSGSNPPPSNDAHASVSRTESNIDGIDETRPKNVYVNYIIKY